MVADARIASVLGRQLSSIPPHWGMWPIARTESMAWHQSSAVNPILWEIS
jgi:hypothetical protein